MELTLKIPWSPKMLSKEFQEDIPQGITIHVPPVRQQRDVFLNHIPWVTVSVIISSAAGLAQIADFVWKKFGAGKRPVEKVELNRRTEIKWTKESLTIALTEEFKSEKKD
jgi:hypothetical protein